MKIIITVEMSGHGNRTFEDVEITEEELEQYACDKMRETDASPRIQVYSGNPIRVEI